MGQTLDYGRAGSRVYSLFLICISWLSYTKYLSQNSTSFLRMLILSHVFHLAWKNIEKTSFSISSWQPLPTPINMWIYFHQVQLPLDLRMNCWNYELSFELKSKANNHFVISLVIKSSKQLHLFILFKSIVIKAPSHFIDFISWFILTTLDLWCWQKFTASLWMSRWADNIWEWNHSMTQTVKDNRLIES